MTVTSSQLACLCFRHTFP